MRTDADITDAIASRNNFFEPKDHENPEYPVSLYFTDLYQSYMHSIRWHWHEEIEVLIIHTGQALVTTDDESYVLHPGQGMLINQNVMHAIRCIDNCSCTYYSLVFHPDFLFGHTNSFMRTQFLLPLQGSAMRKVLELDAEKPWHKELMELLWKVIQANQTKSYSYELLTKGWLCELWAMFVAHLPQQAAATNPQNALDEQRVKEAMLFIRQHHADPITLDDIAESIPISKSECCRCFKRTIQMTPFEYLMKYRIYEASKKMLEYQAQGLSIASLASSVGFNNISYFNKVFRRYLDCTPTEYRERVSRAASGEEEKPFGIPLS